MTKVREPVLSVTDATATFDRTGIDGRNRAAEELHAAALGDLHHEFATLIGTEAVTGSRSLNKVAFNHRSSQADVMSRGWSASRVGSAGRSRLPLRDRLL